MTSLELKIPPPIVALGCAAAMYGLAQLFPSGWVAIPARLHLAIGLAGAGVAADVAGIWAFRLHRTTINPLTPHKSSSVVQDGIYRFTRNPMYLGMLLLLSAWAIGLANLWSLLPLPCFVAYLTRFQIQPEERSLLAKFGQPYAQYLQRVRRWL